MHIVNAMFGSGLGGIEQALVDYSEALKMKGHKVTAIINKKAKIKPALLPLGVNIIEVENFGPLDIFAQSYLKKILKQLQPDAIIVHGSRAASLIKGARDKHQEGQKSPPLLVGVTHNYNIKRLMGLDLILAITEDLKNKVIEAGQPADKVVKLPNMVRTGELGTGNIRNQILDSSIPNSNVPYIGAMGRFVQKKGFDVYIKALGELQKQGLEFKAILGGSGEEEESLKKLADEVGLDSKLQFTGWVKDKQEFFDNIDIFCIPSLHEPFGIILLEAFAHGKAVIVTDSEGPSEIAVNELDALVIPKGDSTALADAINQLAGNKNLATQLIQNAFAKAKTYDISHFAEGLDGVLRGFVKK